jgi:hypothetical protein
MTGKIRIREVRREQIDIDKLVAALLRLAREQLVERDARAAKPAEAQDE